MLSTSILGVSSRHRNKEDSLRNKAYLRLKEKIIRTEMPPASLVDEEELSRELKVGYTPIRQALQRLALENLVVILPRRGTMVADINASDLQKIYELRVELVPHAFSLAAKRVTERQIARIEDYLEKSKSAIAKGSREDVLMVDRQVQCLVVEATQNEFLIEILDQLYSHSMRSWYVNLSKAVSLRKEVAQYHQIVEALRNRNGKLAAKIIQAAIVNFHREHNAAA